MTSSNFSQVSSVGVGESAFGTVVGRVRALHCETWIKLTSSNSEKTSRTLEATESKILNELHLFS